MTALPVLAPGSPRLTVKLAGSAWNEAEPYTGSTPLAPRSTPLAMLLVV
ncbi:MAG: hypothetical protein U1F67_23590 [Rubrivivax sp.]